MSTYDARAEAKRRYGAPDFATPNDRTIKYASFIEGAEWAAGTTTANTEDAEAVVAAEFDNAPDEGWDSLTFAQHIVQALHAHGLLADAGRAGTTTATTEDAQREAVEAILDAHGEAYDSDCGMFFGCNCGWDNDDIQSNEGYAEHVAQALATAGLLATARTETAAPTEDALAVARAYGSDVPAVIVEALAIAGLLARPTPSREALMRLGLYGKQADAVLDLLKGGTDE